MTWLWWTSNLTCCATYWMYTSKFQIDISKHVEKSQENLDGGTDGETDGHCHGITWPSFEQAYNLSQCWPSSLSPYGVTRPQWVKDWTKCPTFCRQDFQMHFLEVIMRTGYGLVPSGNTSHYLSHYLNLRSHIAWSASLNKDPNMYTGLILGLHPANERRRYFVTTSLIGWTQA